MTHQRFGMPPFWQPSRRGSLCHHCGKDDDDDENNRVWTWRKGLDWDALLLSRCFALTTLDRQKPISSTQSWWRASWRTAVATRQRNGVAFPSIVASKQASNHNNHRKRNERQGLLLLGLVVWVMACEQSCHACHNIVDGGARSIAKTRRTTRSTQTDRRCGGLNLSRHRPSPSEHTRTHQNTPEFCILGSCLILYADR